MAPVERANPTREERMRQVSYGGQAVIDGVMMRGRRAMAVAVRDRQGRIVVHSEPIERGALGATLARLPLVRGVLTLVDTVRLGLRALLFSAAVAARDEADEQPAMPAVSDRALWGLAALSLAFVAGLLFILPLLLVSLIDPLIASPLVSNLVEGLIRLGFLLGYLVVVNRRTEVGRLFGYHGAEHQTINAFEAGAALTPASVRRFGLTHPRCGTSFLLLVVLLSVVVFALLGRPDFPVRLATRLLMLPVIAALAYEAVRLTTRLYRYPLTRWLAAPGLALQRLTTRPPDDGMRAVAIAALERVLLADRVVMAASPEPAWPRESQTAGSVHDG
jgi:uncharacterized protein YqhQ